MSLGKGSDIKISKTQISHILKKGLGIQNGPMSPLPPPFGINFKFIILFLWRFNIGSILTISANILITLFL